MGGGIAMLLVGFLAGGAAASVVWAIVVFGRRRAVDAQNAQREQIMTEVGETLAEADAIETNFRSGILTSDAFRRSLGDRVNAIMRLLRTNMHVLDPYFVKYAEQEAREYLCVIDNPERRRQEGRQVPAEPIPGAVVKADMYESQPVAPPEQSTEYAANMYELPAAPASAPVAVAVGAVDRYEPPPTVSPVPSINHTTASYQPPVAPPAPIAVSIGAVDDFEPPPVAPAPIAVAADATDTVDTIDDFEPPPATPAEPHVVDTVNTYQPPPAAPELMTVTIGAVDDFEPPFAPPGAPDVVDTVDLYELPSAATPVPGAGSAETTSIYRTAPEAAVREEELVLGESPDDRDATFTYAPPPAPIQQADTFAPPPAAAWSGGDSIEEFEAAFEQFEIPASHEYAETPPNRQADGQEMATETNSIDRGAILNAMAAPGQTPPPVQGPLMMPEPSEQDVQVPLDQVAQHIENEARREQQEHQGITGDDVVDSIDSFFKLN